MIMEIKNKIIVCGGGRKNNSLIKQIKLNSKKNLSFFILKNLEINGDFIESQAFAYLAIRSILSFQYLFHLQLVVQHLAVEVKLLILD